MTIQWHWNGTIKRALIRADSLPCPMPAHFLTVTLPFTPKLLYNVCNYYGHRETDEHQNNSMCHIQLQNRDNPLIVYIKGNLTSNKKITFYV